MYPTKFVNCGVLKPGQNMWRQCCSKNQIIVFWNSTEYFVPNLMVLFKLNINSVWHL